MKTQIVLNKPNVRILEFGKVDFDKSQYFGLKYENGKAFLTRKMYDYDNYFWLCASKMTNGNKYCNGIDDPSVGFLDIPKAISHAVNMKDEVYIFDTYQELFRWLAED